eukprot:6459329-Amphidinium_carterae.1
MDIASVLRGAAKVGDNIPARDVSCLLATVESGKVYLCQRAHAMLLENPGCVAVFQYSGDSTPVRLQHYAVHGKRRTSTSITSEFYVQQLFVSVLCHNSDWKHTLLYTEPFKVPEKTMAQFLACAQTLPGWSLLREGGRIRIFHQVADRAMGALFRESLSGWVGGSCPSDVYLWETSVGRSAHDFHNACLWSSKMLFADKDILNNVYVAFGCYRKGFYHAMSGLCRWLSLNVGPTHASACRQPAILEEVFTLLHMDSSAREFLCHFAMCSLDDDHHQLQVNAMAMEGENWLEELSGHLLDIWRLPAFSASRWVSIGTTCRHYMICRLTGYDMLYSYLLQTSAISEWDGGGVRKLGQSELQWCLVMALVSTVSDAGLAFVLQDSRAAMHAAGLQATVVQAVEGLESMSLQALDWLAASVHLNVSQLRHLVVRGALISWAYMKYKLLDTLSSWPWVLCAGDREENLRELRQSDEVPAEAVTRKIWTLLRAGEQTSTILRGLA